MLPLLTVGFAFTIWYAYGIVKKQPFFEKRATPQDVTTKDKFVVTCGTLLFLMFPTLCSGAFRLFDCRTVGTFAYLHSAMDEQCYTGRHLTIVILLGFGQLFAYVIGLPLLLLWFLHRNREGLHLHVTQVRYGLFYSAYENERYYWEIVLLSRKIIIVALTLFGPILGTLR